jgi:hypothetical protein
MGESIKLHKQKIQFNFTFYFHFTSDVGQIILIGVLSTLGIIIVLLILLTGVYFWWRHKRSQLEFVEPCDDHETSSASLKFQQLLESQQQEQLLEEQKKQQQQSQQANTQANKINSKLNGFLNLKTPLIGWVLRKNLFPFFRAGLSQNWCFLMKQNYFQQMAKTCLNFCLSELEETFLFPFLPFISIPDIENLRAFFLFVYRCIIFFPYFERKIASKEWSLPNLWVRERFFMFISVAFFEKWFFVLYWQVFFLVLLLIIFGGLMSKSMSDS